MSSIHASRRGADDSELQDLIERFDLEQWLDDEGVEYNLTSGQSGEQINVTTCPRCGGSKKKVFLNRETGLGNCFHGSCVGEPGFNKFTFIQHYTGENAKVVIDIIKLQAEEQGWRPKRKREPVKVTVPDTITLPESTELPVNGRNLKYLTERGFTPQTVGAFHLRYSVNGCYWYKDIEGKSRRQNYAKRVIIPLFDSTGKMVTFQGRDITGGADRKYLFPPMLPSTGRYLYNAHKAKGERDLIIGEGVFDVMAIHQAINRYKLNDECAVVGSFGISFSTGPEQQLCELQKLIDTGVRSVTFMWDGGKKATNAAFKNALELATRIDVPIRIAQLPGESDPNEVSPKQVIDAFNNAIGATQPNYIRYTLKR